MKTTSLVSHSPYSNPTSTQRSWFEAYRLFLMNPKERLGVKLLPLIAAGILPLSLADDLLLPILGIADDIPTILVVLFALVRTWQRVRTYR